MHPFRAVRRLLSRAHEDWQDALEALFARPSHPPGPRPLRVMRLERRRVLSADFTLSASGLVLSGFDGVDGAGGDTLVVTQQEETYQFTNSSGWEQHDANSLPEGVSIDGNTLSVDRDLLEALDDGLFVAATPGLSLNVQLGDVDFSGLEGPVTLAGATSVGQQQEFALFTAPTDGLRLLVAPGGTVLSDLSVSGDLEIVSFGSITDLPDSQIVISGNATFISRAMSPAGDFNGDGKVDELDRSEHWAVNYGMTSGASKFDGDANGDGRVDAADYTLWRDSVGQTGRGGIQLADTPGDRLVIGGVATFDAAEPAGVHDVFIGVQIANGQVAGEGGRAEFGSLNAYGANVIIQEDATDADALSGGPTTVVGAIEAYHLQLIAAGRIEAPTGSNVAVEGDARLTSLSTNLEPPVVGAVPPDLPGGILIAGSFQTGGLMSLVAEDGDSRFDITVADAATANFGSLIATGGVVTIYEDGGTFKPQRDGSQAGTHLEGITAQQLRLVSAGGITDAPGAKTEVAGDATFIVSESALIADGPLVQAIVLADRAEANSLNVTGVATFIVEPPATATAGFTGPKGIDVGVVASGAPAAAFFNAGSLRFSAPGGSVRIAEDSATVLAGWSVDSGVPAITAAPTMSTAATFDLNAAGSITDAPNAVVVITDDATLQAAGAITLADEGAANVFTVGDLATFVSSLQGVRLGVAANDASAAATFNTGRLRFAIGGQARIAEDSGVVFAGWTVDPVSPIVVGSTVTDYSFATNLAVSAQGSITDEASASLVVSPIRGPGFAGSPTIFVATEDIVLFDSGVGNSFFLSAPNAATFVAGQGRKIDLGVTAAGAPADADYRTGSLRFSAPGGVVRIAEDDGTVIDTWDGYSDPFLASNAPTKNEADVLELCASLSVVDLADAQTAITGDATVVASQGITLADGGAGNSFTVGDLATFVVGPASQIRVGLTAAPADATFTAGRLRFSAPGGAARFAEDDGTLLAGWTTDAAAPCIATPPTASAAATFELNSAGDITDAVDAVVNVTSNATLQAAGSITLANGGAANVFTVGDLATFVQTGAFPMRLGVDGSNAPDAATFNTGRLRFDVGSGQARIAEDSGVVFASWGALPPIVTAATSGRTTAGDLAISASGSITDQPGVFIDVSATALFVATEDIVLADGGEGSGLSVAARSAFVAGQGRKIDIGMTAAGTPAAATFNAGSLLFAAPQGVVRIAEDSGALIDAWANFSDALLPAPPQQNVASVLELCSAGSVEDAIGAQTAITDDATIVAQQNIALADGGAANTFTVGDLATFVAGDSRAIAVGVNNIFAPVPALFTAGRLRFAAPNGLVGIAEDDGTLLAGWPMGSTAPCIVTPPMASEARTIELASAGDITDAADAVVLATGRNGLVRVFDPNATATFVASGSITLADGAVENKIAIDGRATFVAGNDAARRIDVGVTPTGGEAAAEFVAGSVRFSTTSGAVRLVEDAVANFKEVAYNENAGTVLADWLSTPIPTVLVSPPDRSTAGSLQIVSAGPITDAPNAFVQVAGDAGFRVKAGGAASGTPAILLAEGLAANKLNVGGAATFVAPEATGIYVGAGLTGEPAAAEFNAGSLRFNTPGGVVRLAEDSSTLLAGWGSLPVGLIRQPSQSFSVANTLELSSAGSITDEGGAALLVTDDATFIAAAVGEASPWGIQLADGPADNRMAIGDLATFIVTAENKGVRVGVTASGTPANAQFVAGRSRFSAPTGDVQIAEDRTISLGSLMTDATPGTALAGWAPGSVSELLVPADPASSRARSLELASASLISDAPDAIVEVTNNAGFVVTEALGVGGDAVMISLADDNAAGTINRLTVGGVATFIAQGQFGIRIGTSYNVGTPPAAATFDAGAIRFSAPMTPVRFAEDSGTVLASWDSLPGGVLGLAAGTSKSTASSLQLTADGAITDEATAKVDIAGNATFLVSSITNVGAGKAIELANEGSANELLIGGLASFTVSQQATDPARKGIDVGVTAMGVPADAVFMAGTLGFSAPGAMVRIAEDSDTVLGASSLAEDLQLLSTGSIDDTPAASTTITRSAELNAADGTEDVTLGAGASSFSMGAPSLFEPTQYLAIQARNVSVEADSAVNIRTGDAPLNNLTDYSNYAGLYYLTAQGSVSQVTGAAPTPLAADRISVASDQGAVLLRLVELTSTGADPNLQIKAGGVVALSQPLVAGGTVEDRFAGADIPTPDNRLFAPLIVESDDPTTGVRTGVTPRGDAGFENLVAGGENSRLSEANPAAASDAAYDHFIDNGSGGPRTIDDLYSAVVIVQGNATIGDVQDIGNQATNPRRDVDTDDARGFVVASIGNGFLATRTSGAEAGDLLFTSAGRELQETVMDATAVQMMGGVFTAIAAGVLTIDTKDPKNVDPTANLRTTRLTSVTGVVTSVGSGVGADFGPWAEIDPSTEVANAATTGLVRADQDFEQRVTLAVGSRGEDNLLVEVEWADVADTRQYSEANVRLAADPNLPTNTVGSTSVPGSQLYADLTQTPVGAIEANVADPGVTGYQYQQLQGESRVGTLTHNYAQEFVPSNPAQNRLPTTIRVFNDASINLYDQGGARNLNGASFAIAPRIITLPPPGYFILSEPDLPERYEPAASPIARLEPTQTPQQTIVDDGRAVVASTAEEVLYGRVDKSGDWITDIPGEPWPQVLEDAEGDFLREIRDKIDEGPYSEGRYIIKVVTPRSEQLLEEWVKGDDASIGSEQAPPPAAAVAPPAAEGAQPAAEETQPGPEGAQPADKAPQPAQDATPAAAPLGTPLGQGSPNEPSTDARNAAFAAMAAVGVWRRRLNEAGPFTLDADGVAFTRVRRQRRRRSGE